MTRLKCKGVLSISKWLFFHLCHNHCTCVTIFLNMGQSLPLFRLFSSFSHHKSISNWKRVDGVLGIRTCGHRMVGADETTELWRPPVWPFFIHNLWSTKSARGSNFFVSVIFYVLRKLWLPSRHTREYNILPITSVTRKNCQMNVKVAQKWFH